LKTGTSLESGAESYGPWRERAALLDVRFQRRDVVRELRQSLPGLIECFEVFLLE
jgi:hypothetical protein